ncbi:MAG: flagellar biosynthesis protein FlgL [Myxococcaceae bacterium]|jgi:flagellar hook-associated protein 3 FlgL|nr:flagellar biosynthesis protein FlgL [Myxococcaceae bacterium]
MRVSDSYVFDQANTRLMRTRRESTEAADRVSSGKRVETPWDDSAAAGLITRFAQDRARQDAMMTAANRASEELAVVDGAFDQVLTAVTRAQELAVQLSNDTYSAADRRNAAVEVQQIFQQVLTSINLRFGDRYVFGGTADQAPPFDPAGAYLGNASTRRVEIAPGILQDASVRADVAFKGAGGGVDVLTSLATFATALSANDATGIRTAIRELADGSQQITAARSRAGAMMNVFDLASSTARVNRDDATKGRSALEDIDLIDASTRFAAAERALEASMSAVARSFRLTLLDKL